MNCLQNLHTHTIYDDGKNTPEELILVTCEKGFDSLGFSGHSPLPFFLDYAMTAEGLEEYKKEIAALKQKYEGKIDVYCGLEFDIYSHTDLTGYDYVIGSVHCIPFENEVVEFDRSAEATRSYITRYFGGDGMVYARAYYERLMRLPEYGKIDIIGHFDLVTKFCEQQQFFDMESKEYRSLVVETAEALVGEIPYFEVNTGAISRGYRTTPYPDMYLLKELKRLGFGVVITSDCHDSKDLDCGFLMATDMLRECGFKERFVLTKQGFVPVAL